MMGKNPAQTYFDIDKKRDYESLREKLKLAQLAARTNLTKKHPHVEKFFRERGLDLGKLREHSSKIIASGLLTGGLLFTSPFSNLAQTFDIPAEIAIPAMSKDEKTLLAPKEKLLQSLTSIFGKAKKIFEREEEKKLEAAVYAATGLSTRANLEGERLNTIYGLIGAEQHLRRYPADTLGNHRPYLAEGIAPGLGAWGYLASSRQKLTRALEEIERWYAVVQTLYLPEWGRRQPYLRDWYKYRKVLIINTLNGNAVVASILDSGPAAWTGKHFGGSPEVMEYLGGKRYKKGPVVVLFLDDPNNEVPLGPVEYNSRVKE